MPSYSFLLLSHRGDPAPRTSLLCMVVLRATRVGVRGIRTVYNVIKILSSLLHTINNYYFIILVKLRKKEGEVGKVSPPVAISIASVADVSLASLIKGVKQYSIDGF